MKNYRLNCYQIIKQMIKIFIPILSKLFYSYLKRHSTTLLPTCLTKTKRVKEIP